MIRRPLPLFIVSLFLGAICELFLLGEPLDARFPIFILLCLVGGGFALLANDRFPAPGSLALIPLLIFFAMMTSFTSGDPSSLKFWIALGLTIFFAALLSVTYLGGRWMQYSTSDYVKKFSQLAGSLLTRPVTFTREWFRSLPHTLPREHTYALHSVVGGVTIAIPVVGIFLLLLVAIDQTYRHLYMVLVDDAIEVFKQAGRHVPPTLLLSYLLAGVFLHAGTQSGDEIPVTGVASQVVRPLLGIPGSAVILLGALVPLLPYAALQLVYLAEGAAAGGDASEASISGFTSRAVVAMASFLLVYGLSTVTRRETALGRLFYILLNVVILFLEIIILAAAFQFLSLNREIFAGSERLFYAYAFLLWLGVLFVVFVLLEILERERDFAFIALVITTGGAGGLLLRSFLAALA